MTKKKIWIISLSVVVVMLIAVAFGVALSSPKIGTAGEKIERQVSESDEDWKVVSDGAAAIQTDNFSIAVDAKTGHLTVEDKRTGASYSSVASVADENQKNQSELILTYYDENSTVLTMNTAQNCVDNGNVIVKTDGEKIRVIYPIQKSKTPVFVPEVISAATFDEKILTKLESGEKRRLKRFYTLYEPDASDSATKEKKSQFPALKKEALYILGDTSSASNAAEITSYMKKAEYGEKQYTDEMTRLGMEGSASTVSSAGFTVPLEYSIDENGFRATVLNDRIVSESSSYVLTDIEVLPYFACVEEASDGFLLVPDGSGAIIELEEKTGVNYIQNVYGADPSISQDRQAAVVQNVGMPIFGMNDGSKAFLAVIESSDAAATINAEVLGKEFAASRIYSKFKYTIFDTSSAMERNMGNFNLYAQECMSENPQIYYILGSGEMSYSEMANDYREYLIAQGVLGEKLTQDTPLYLDFTGYETTEASIMGISTNEKALFSDLEGIEDALDRLEEAGITGAQVRLKAYADGGLYSKVQNGLKLDSLVGTEKQLKALAERLVADGGRLYLENQISTIWKEGNGFNKNHHASKDLKKMVAKGLDYDLVSRKELEVELKYMLTSPTHLNYLTEKFIGSFGKDLGEASLYGYSRSDFGSKLWSDFNQKQQVDRSQSAAYAEQAAKLAKENFAGVMTDGNNSYAVQYADHLLNMSLGGSDYRSESYSIPFYQMVLHGYKSYAGAPLNVSFDGKKTYLQSAESGAGLYYSCYTESSEILKKSIAGTLMYPTQFSSQADTIAAQYQEYQEVFSELYNQVITKHQCVSDSFRVTTYENGTQIAVNYSDQEFVYEGITVPAGDFAVIKEGTK